MQRSHETKYSGVRAGTYERGEASSRTEQLTGLVPFALIQNVLVPK